MTDAACGFRPLPPYIYTPDLVPIATITTRGLWRRGLVERTCFGEVECFLSWCNEVGWLRAANITMNIQLTLCLLSVVVASVSVSVSEGSAIVGALHRGARQVDMGRFRYWNKDGDVDDHFVFEEDQPVKVISTTTTMRPTTTVAVPGMGTARTPCEDACQTTNQYNPVCGDDNVTYYNHARLSCATRCGKRVQMSRLGRCSVWTD